MWKLRTVAHFDMYLFFMSLLTFCPPPQKNKQENSQLSFPRMPPSLWWFSFNPCLSICSSPDLSASYILPPGFSHHLKQSLKIWLQKKQQQRLGTRWDTSMCSVFRHFSTMMQDFFFAQLLCFYLFFSAGSYYEQKNRTYCLFVFPAHIYIVLEENAVFTLSFMDH